MLYYDRIDVTEGIDVFRMFSCFLLTQLNTLMFMQIARLRIS